MIDTVLTWFALYGVQTLFFALCAGQTGIIPVPTTIILLSVGTILADKTVAPLNVFISCLSGAMLGDQFGYAVGRAGGPAFAAYLADSRWGKMFKRAEIYSKRWGAIGVFFSRWLVSPIGPYLNYLVGMTGLPWAKFTMMSFAGDAIWVAGFLSIGYLFNASITSIDSLISNTIFFIGGLIATVFLWSRIKRSLAKSNDNETSD